MRCARRRLPASASRRAPIGCCARTSKSGAVKPVLSAYAPEGAPISVLYPANRFLPAKVRVFIDFLIEITKG